MILSAEELGAGTSHECHVCIIGAGPAGLLLARELASPTVHVTLLEAGGLDQAETRSSLLEGDDLTGEYHNPRESRHCQLGGTVRIWNTPVAGKLGAKHVPLDPIDFERRDWVPHSGWPISYDELIPYYERAHDLCGLGPFDYKASSWTDEYNAPFDLKDDQIVTGVYQLGSPSPFTGELVRYARECPWIKCVLNAPVGELVGEKAERGVSSALVHVSAGGYVHFRADRFVLAAGGIENARLLLASKSQCAAGLGNEHDVVGRYYMDHPVFFFTEIQPELPDLFKHSGFYDLREVRGTTVLGRMTLSPKSLRERQLLNLSVVLYPKLIGYRSAGIEAIRQLRLNVRSSRLREAARHLLPTLSNLGDAFSYYKETRRNTARGEVHHWHASAVAGGRYGTFEPEFYLEQPPDPNNRILLSENKDALGRPRAAIHWRWGKQSEDSAFSAAKMLGEAFQKSQLGCLNLLRQPRVNPTGHHHMGATRMADDPRSGVVDKQCRLHRTANVYVAGSSVFPTGGYANPTLTIMALCFRLADHLKSQNSIRD